MASQSRQRRQQPLAQQPRAHRRHGAVDGLQQRDALRAGLQWLDQLQVAPRHLVDPAQLRRCGEPRVASGAAIPAAAVRGRSAPAHRRRRARARRPGPVPARRARRAEGVVPSLRRPSAGSNSHASRSVMQRVVAPRQVAPRRHARFPPATSRSSVSLSARRATVSSTSSPVDRSRAATPGAIVRRGRDRDQPVVPRTRRPFVVEKRPRRHGLDHRALDDAPGELRVFHLFADRHPMTLRRPAAADTPPPPSPGPRPAARRRRARSA